MKQIPCILKTAKKIKTANNLNHSIHHECKFSKKRELKVYVYFVYVGI